MQIFIGTSGFQYSHWNNGVFYPRGVKNRLGYALQKMSAIEINSSFYRIPPPDTVSAWAAGLPEHARLVLKAPQSVSHRRRLKLYSDPSVKQGVDLLTYFIEGVVRIPDDHRGPVLLQLPHQMEIALERLEPVLDLFHRHQLRVALEVRHGSWLVPPTYRMLERYQAALVASDWPELKTPVTVTADFVYLRRHGPQELYASSYDDEALLADLEIVKKQTVPFAYIFFNNDIHGYAPNNAIRMQELLHPGRGAFLRAPAIDTVPENFFIDPLLSSRNIPSPHSQNRDLTIFDGPQDPAGIEPPPSPDNLSGKRHITPGIKTP